MRTTSSWRLKPPRRALTGQPAVSRAKIRGHMYHGSGLWRSRHEFPHCGSSRLGMLTNDPETVYLETVFIQDVCG